MIDPDRRQRIGGAAALVRRLMRGALFRKYVVLFVAVMATALVTSSLVNIWFAWREQRADLIRIQSEQAAAAAARITQFIKEIEGQLGWMTHLSWTEPAGPQRELDSLRLLRQVPAITELSLLDHQGREQFRFSRQAMDRIGSKADLSSDERFTAALAQKVYYGPVYFRRQTEPYMTLAVAGTRREAGVTMAEVSLTHIWDVVSRIRVGRTGRAYVVDANGRLIAHPDISLVLRNVDLSGLAQVRSAREEAAGGAAGRVQTARDVRGARVVSAHARAEPLKWLVLVELPEREAIEPLYAAATRAVLVVLAGLVLALLAALLLARRMAGPIESLTAGARRIGTGALDHRIAIMTGDELEALGRQFNQMAEQLQGSYATLERKVEERTDQLQSANLAKSRFLAAASHDLRQPLHALNLFVAQLGAETDPAERARLAGRIGAAVGNMNELFNALLDVSRLDAGALQANVASLAVDNLLSRIEATFAEPAREKGLDLRVVPCSAWVASDAILLERILLNLVSNAVRYTTQGGIVIGCRRRGVRLRIDVCDTGIGIAPDQQREIFGEFYQVAAGRERRDGLGLGLAIVERLCTLLAHPLELVSAVGRGSRFSIMVPLAETPAPAAVKPEPAPMGLRDPLKGRLVVVIDDDPMVLEGTGGLLRSWGCRVVAAATDGAAMAGLDGLAPDLVISDFRLGPAQTGVDAIARLRTAHGLSLPAFLISGDISPDRLSQAREHGLRLLHKPVDPMALRALATQLVRPAPPADAR